jgi:DNA-binding LacI/PurR family transcriptional regulator
MIEVAARAGFSLKTVSRVVNNDPHVSDDTRQRVQRAIDDLGYTRNELGWLLRTKTGRPDGPMRRWLVHWTDSNGELGSFTTTTSDILNAARVAIQVIGVTGDVSNGMITSIAMEAES